MSKLAVDGESWFSAAAVSSRGSRSRRLGGFLALSLNHVIMMERAPCRLEILLHRRRVSESGLASSNDTFSACVVG